MEKTGNSHEYEKKVVLGAHAVINPYTMMIKTLHTTITLPAVPGTSPHVNRTSRTK
jgi:hypothetical protein